MQRKYSLLVSVLSLCWHSVLPYAQIYYRIQLFTTSESFLPFQNGNRVNSGPQGWNVGNDLREKYLTYFRVFLTSVRHAQEEKNIRV